MTSHQDPSRAGTRSGAPPPPLPAPRPPHPAYPVYPPPSPPPKSDNTVLIVVIVVVVIVVAIALSALLAVMLAGIFMGPQITRPAVALGTPVTLPDGSVRIDVVSASQRYPGGVYSANLEVASTVGAPVDIEESGVPLSVLVGGQAYNVTWTDLGRSVFLDAGDRFTVSRAGGLPAATNMTFYLLWADESIVGTATWRT